MNKKSSFKLSFTIDDIPKLLAVASSRSSFGSIGHHLLGDLGSQASQEGKGFPLVRDDAAAMIKRLVIWELVVIHGHYLRI